MINDDWSKIKKDIDKLMNEICEIRTNIEMLKEIKGKSIKITGTIALLNLKLFYKSMELMNLSNYAGVENPNKRKRNLK